MMQYLQEFAVIRTVSQINCPKEWVAQSFIIVLGLGRQLHGAIDLINSLHAWMGISFKHTSIHLLFLTIDIGLSYTCDTNHATITWLSITHDCSHVSCLWVQLLTSGTIKYRFFDKLVSLLTSYIVFEDIHVMHGT